MSQRRHDTVTETMLLPVTPVGAIAAEVAPRRWLIEELWGDSSVGFLAGSPKCCKSFLGLDMAVSVASGTRCLGRYRVPQRGRVLVYLAEDGLAAVRERVAALVRHRGLALGTLDLHVITAASLRLDQPPDRERLRATIDALRPRLLLLDPLVRLHALDENHSTAMAGLLSYFRELQRSFELSIVIVHHTRKSGAGESQRGQALRGSGDLFAFFDSALYLRRSRDELLLAVEHRAAPAPEPVSLELVAEDEESLHLEISGPVVPGKERRGRDVEAAVLELLQERGPLNRTQLRHTLGVRNERLGKALESLEERGLLVRTHGGWNIPHNGASAERSLRSE